MTQQEYLAEQIFYHVLLRGGEGNPFRAINAGWFTRLAASKLGELLSVSPAPAATPQPECAQAFVNQRGDVVRCTRTDIHGKGQHTAPFPTDRPAATPQPRYRICHSDSKCCTELYVDEVLTAEIGDGAPPELYDEWYRRIFDGAPFPTDRTEPVNHVWVRELIDACTDGNSHGNYVGNQVLCHRAAFQINKHFGLEMRQWNTDGDPERDADFKDPYPIGDYFAEVRQHHARAERTEEPAKQEKCPTCRGERNHSYSKDCLPCADPWHSTASPVAQKEPLDRASWQRGLEDAAGVVKQAWHNPECDRLVGAIRALPFPGADKKEETKS